MAENKPKEKVAFPKGVSLPRGNATARKTVKRRDSLEKPPKPIPESDIKETVARYNELARLGKDLDFGKRPDRLTTIEKPPYYAGKGFYALVPTSASLQVLTMPLVVPLAPAPQIELALWWR